MGTSRQFLRHDVAGAKSPWWETLDCPPTATLSEIEAAYRRLARQAHPDFWSSASADERNAAELRMKQLNAAIATARRTVAKQPTAILVPGMPGGGAILGRGAPSNLLAPISEQLQLIATADLVFCIIRAVAAVVFLAALLYGYFHVADNGEVFIETPASVGTDPQAKSLILAELLVSTPDAQIAVGSILVGVLGAIGNWLLLRHYRIGRAICCLVAALTFAAILFAPLAWLVECKWTDMARDEATKAFWLNVARTPWLVLYIAALAETFRGGKKTLPVQVDIWKLG